MIGTLVQVYNLISWQWQPEAVKDYWEPRGFLVMPCGRRVLLCFQWGVCGGGEWATTQLHQTLLYSTKNYRKSYTLNAVSKVLVTSG